MCNAARTAIAAVVTSVVASSCAGAPSAPSNEDASASSSAPVVASSVPSASPITSSSAAVEAPPEEDWFDGHAATRHPKRAHLVELAGVSFSPKGAPIEGAVQLSNPIVGIVIEESPKTLRLLIGSSKVKLLVYTPITSTALVPITATWLSPTESDAPKAGVGVRLAPGVSLLDLATHGDFERVAGEIDNVAFNGWAASRDLGHAYEPAPFAVAKDSPSAALEGSKVIDEAGNTVAKLTSAYANNQAFVFPVRAVPFDKKGYQGIDFIAPNIEVIGGVDSASFSAKPASPRAGWGATGSDSWTWHHEAREVTVKPDTAIYDARGKPIGRIDEPTRMVAFPSEGETRASAGFTVVEVLVDELGMVKAWARSTDLEDVPAP